MKYNPLDKKESSYNKKELEDNPIKIESYFKNIWHEGNYTYYTFLFPYASKTLKEIVNLFSDLGIITPHNQNKIDTAIMKTIKKYLKSNYYKKSECFYVFFDLYLIFCKKIKQEWFTKIVKFDNLGELYKKLKPLHQIRKLTDCEINFISKKTGHLHNYNVTHDYNLLYKVIQTAIEDALSFARPRNTVQSHMASANGKKDIRSSRERDSYNARLFLLEPEPYINRILDLLDIDHEIFYSNVAKQINNFDKVTEQGKV